MSTLNHLEILPTGWSTTLSVQMRPQCPCSPKGNEKVKLSLTNPKECTDGHWCHHKPINTKPNLSPSDLYDVFLYVNDWNLIWKAYYAFKTYCICILDLHSAILWPLSPCVPNVRHQKSKAFFCHPTSVITYYGLISGVFRLWQTLSHARLAIPVINFG
jgi:hypothetical protein